MEVGGCPFCFFVVNKSEGNRYIMKKRVIVALPFLILIIGTMRLAARQSTPTSSAPASTSDLERRIYQLEVAQTQTVESLKSSNEHNKFLIQMIGIIFMVLVTIQGVTTFFQVRREKQRYDLQSEQVSKIMNVVHQTLESRLTAEEEARERANKAQDELQRVHSRFISLERFYRNFQTTIKIAREAIEETASRLANTSRHDFRQMTSELNSFAEQFERFKTDFEAIEEEPNLQFSTRVPYIRGIAAHYANQPEVVKQYLTDVVGIQQPESGETVVDLRRRIANSYYYLGLTESNFGYEQKAIRCFEKANELDLQNRDFLTRIVTAEAYIMINDFDKAKQFITEVEQGLDSIKRQIGHLRNVDLRLLSRATLMKANMAIMNRKDNWRKAAQEELESVHDPQYYYATVALAQIGLDVDSSEAQRLFSKSYEEIERSGHLLTVTEVRIKILLLMVAGICCKHGLRDKRRSDEYLDRAEALLGSLPKLGPKVCTVFSALSFRNENHEIIRQHIDLIRRGDVLLVK